MSIPTIQVGTGNQSKVVEPILLCGIGPDGQPIALQADLSGKLLSDGGSSGSSTVAVYTVPSSITGAVTLDRTNGPQQNATASGNVTLNVTGGSDFNALDLWLTASGADRTLALHASVLTPSDSGITYPVTILSGKSARIKLEKHSSSWTITSILKSY
jgi:hypothetical protein